MLVSTANDVKQYNLTAGRSLPEWLDERKRRRLVKRDVELRRRVELLQDFSMPAVSGCVRVSGDGNFVLATGTYKPRVRCYDVHELGLKFERCLDSEVVAFRMLGEDYSKLVFLRCNRYVEVHNQQGRYYQLRLPRFGRDFEYQASTCDLLFVGDGPEVVRLNLEQGRFLTPFQSSGGPSSLNCCALNPEHGDLLLAGSAHGCVEAWDTRQKSAVSTLDCGLHLPEPGVSSGNVPLPEVTSMAFRNGLELAVGSSTGHVLLYDLRSSRPLLVKDLRYGLPVKKVLFHPTLDQVVSLDSRAVKVWDRQTGKPYTAVEAPSSAAAAGDSAAGDHYVAFNDVAVCPGSGLMFMANEQPKLQVHYVPSMGPAPRWCSFLDNIAEEMEESAVRNHYDDYHFVTGQELSDLGLDHLVGTDLLRAYMHGYFMDARLYGCVQALAKPYTLERFLREKVDQKLEEKRVKRVQLASSSSSSENRVLPKVNRDLFLRLKDQQEKVADAAGVKRTKQSKRAEATAALLEDDRFKDMFVDERFQVDTTEEAFKLLNPVISKLDSARQRRLEKQFSQVPDEEGVPPAGGGESPSSDDDDDEDDDRELARQVREQHRQVRIERAEERRREKAEKLAEKLSAISKREKLAKVKVETAPLKFFELKDDGETTLDKSGGLFFGVKRKRGETGKRSSSLADRLREQEEEGGLAGEDGQVLRTRPDGHEMTFKLKKSRHEQKALLEAKRHREERAALRRSASGLKKKRLPPKFYMGKRVM